MSELEIAYLAALGYQKGVDAAWDALPANADTNALRSVRELRNAAAEAVFNARDAWQRDRRIRKPARTKA